MSTPGTLLRAGRSADCARRCAGVNGAVCDRSSCDALIRRPSPMFDAIPTAPPDPIIGLMESFHADPRPEKVNLSIGEYRGPDGGAPVLSCVKTAEKRLLDGETTKGYFGIAGRPDFNKAVPELILEATIRPSRNAAGRRSRRLGEPAPCAWQVISCSVSRPAHACGSVNQPGPTTPMSSRQPGWQYSPIPTTTPIIARWISRPCAGAWERVGRGCGRLARVLPQSDRRRSVAGPVA